MDSRRRKSDKFIQSLIDEVRRLKPDCCDCKCDAAIMQRTPHGFDLVLKVIGNGETIEGNLSMVVSDEVYCIVRVSAPNFLRIYHEYTCNTSMIWAAAFECLANMTTELVRVLKQNVEYELE